MLEIGSLVKTNLGEGFLIGRTTKPDQPNYDVRLLDGKICVSYPNSFNWPTITNVDLVDSRPIDHPMIPRGLREYLIRRNHGGL